MDYPFELIFPADELPSIVRVRVAAAIIAFDNDPENVLFSEDEYAEFNRPHSFVDKQFREPVAEKIRKIEMQLLRSIESGALKPRILRIAEDERIDARETWLTVSSLDEWCAQRSYEMGEVWAQYTRLESDLFFEVQSRAESERYRLEYPERAESLKARLAAQSATASEHVLEIYRENEELRDKLKRVGGHGAENELRPRERATLLNTIGALLELVQNPRPGRNSQEAVIDELVENYGEKPGIRKRTLAGKFADAKKSLRNG